MKYLRLALAALVFLAGCSQGQNIYDNPDAVSIYLYDAPEISEDEYSINFKFEHNNDEATHFIQKIEWNWNEGAGLEAFRSYNGKLPLGQYDHHYKEKLTYEKRTMTIMAGKVIGADETTLGFSMLPSGWPEIFNPKYMANHTIRGNIVNMYPETTTQYTLEFDRGVLTFRVVGTEVEYVWTASSADGRAEK